MSPKRVFHISASYHRFFFRVKIWSADVSTFRIGSEKMGRSSRRHRDYRTSTMLQSRDYARFSCEFVSFDGYLEGDGSTPLRKGASRAGFADGSKGEQRGNCKRVDNFRSPRFYAKFAIALPFLLYLVTISIYREI